MKQNSIQLSKIRSGKLAWHDVQFQNGFKNYGGVYHNCQYAKDIFGNVYLIGLAANSASNATERPIFTLPEGYRPAGNVIFAAPNGGRSDVSMFYQMAQFSYRQLIIQVADSYR